MCAVFVLADLASSFSWFCKTLLGTETSGAKTQPFELGSWLPWTKRKDLKINSPTSAVLGFQPATTVKIAQKKWPVDGAGAKAMLWSSLPSAPTSQM